MIHRLILNCLKVSRYYMISLKHARVNRQIPFYFFPNIASGLVVSPVALG
jgi:hypothetical protein